MPINIDNITLAVSTVGEIMDLAERLGALFGRNMVLTQEMIDAGQAALPTPLQPKTEEIDE